MRSGLILPIFILFFAPFRPAAASCGSDQIFGLFGRPLGEGFVLPSSQLPIREFVQQSYQNMRALEPHFENKTEYLKFLLAHTDLPALKKIEQLAVQRQIKAYDFLFQELEASRPQSLANYLTREAVAVGNAPHVKEVLGTVVKHRESYRQILRAAFPSVTDSQLDHLMQYLETLVSVHDFGKTVPAAGVLEAAKQVDPKLQFMIGHISLHEISTAAYLEKMAQNGRAHLPTLQSLIRNVLGHNEGSGLKEVFWNQIAHPTELLGKYPLPETLMTDLLTLADRGGQASLGPTGGVVKILRQEVRNGQTFGPPLVKKAMLDNALNTQAQIRVIAHRIGPEADRSALVADLLERQAKTERLYHTLQWNTEKPGGLLQGHEFSDIDGFVKIISGNE